MSLMIIYSSWCFFILLNWAITGAHVPGYHQEQMLCLVIFQVWQNDGLPSQICNKCVAKLHISYQFKRQCEKSDAKLRQYITGGSSVVNEHSPDHHQQQQHPQQTQQPQQQQHNTGQVASVQQQPDSCVYIECNPLIEMGHDHRYDAAMPPVTVAPDITQLGYNQMPISGYSLQTIGQVQVTNIQ